MRTLLLVAVCVILISGCVEGGKPAAASLSISSSAAPVTTTADLGAIHGVVADDELVPVGGADVGIVRTDLKTKTAANGEFTFNDVAPGDYSIVVSALGYEQAIKKISVVVAQVTEVRLELTPVEVQGEPYVRVHHAAFLIQFDWFGVGQLTAIHPYVCSPCDVYQSIQPGASAAFLEPVWQKSVPAPGFSDTLLFQVYTKPVNETFVDGDVVMSKSVASREGFAAGEDGVKLLAKADLINTQVLSPGLTQFAFQQKAESWLSLGYNGPLAEGYTALPP